MEEYPIYTENGKLFCKCRKIEGEGIVLMGKNGEIPFPKFVASVTSVRKPPKNFKGTRRASG